MYSYFNKRINLRIILTFVLCFMFTGGLYSAEEPQNQERKPLRDPMVPFDMTIFESAPQKKITRSPFKIQGLGRSEKTAYVIIGGKVYQEGETKGSVTVVKITGTAVDILVDGQPETLLVKEK